jgi:hypothetical protein
MADGGRVGEFPQNIIGDQRLPLRVVLDERLDMSLQEIGCDRHLSLPAHFRVVVRSEDRSCRTPRHEPLPEAEATQKRTLEAVGSMPFIGRLSCFQ